MTVYDYHQDPSFTADQAALNDINFCGLWATAEPILIQMESVISSVTLKLAIKVVVAGGNAFCNKNSSGDCGSPSCGSEENNKLIEQVAALVGKDKKIKDLNQNLGCAVFSQLVYSAADRAKAPVAADGSVKINGVKISPEDTLGDLVSAITKGH